MTIQICPLCGASSPVFYHQDKHRSYWRCQNCDLIFVPVKFHLSPTAERARYDLHQNNAESDGYVSHLMKIVTPLTRETHVPAKGIDFGSGPFPLLSELIAKQGLDIVNYDPYYARDESVLTSTYDFLTCVEVVEHFRQPDKNFTELFHLVKQGGIIAIMTSLVRQSTNFETWYYKNDPTHINFYAEKTLEWIATHHAATVKRLGDSIAFFYK